MENPSFIRKSVYSALVFFSTLGILSAWYAGFVTLQSSDADTGKPLTSSMMQAVIGNLADLDGRVSVMSGAISSLETNAGNLWGTVTGGIGYSGGNVGIGIATPSQKFSVAGTIESTSGGYKFPDGTTQTTAASATASIPAGAVMAFYLASCPSGWRAADGTNSTPDLRGEFIRGLDSGRGVDASRGLGSWQDATGVGMYVYQWAYSQFVNPDSIQTTATSTSRGGVAGYADNQKYYKVRPRNVALLYCVKS